MIRRVLVAVLVWGMCFAGAAEAADVPFSNLMKKPRVAQSSTVKKLNLKAKAKVVSVVVRKPKPASVATPMVDKPVDPVEQTVAAKQPGSPDVAQQEIDLSWVLDPLVATADGSKREGSASVQGNLIVVEPGYVTSPYMVIELSGHIIKTPGTTVRLDLNIGGTHRSLNWKLDDVQSGRFKVALNAPMAEGQLPAYFPVSALAFVTKEDKQGVAMVSLEKISVRVGKVSLLAAQ
jgi:hypothetical protein